MPMTNKNKSSPREKWTIDQTIVAFYFYCQTPFGKLHSTNPKIIELASFIGRTPSAFAMKCVNFASLDPAILKSGRSGLSNASRLDKEIWEEFHSDGQALIEKAEKLLENFKRDKKLELISEFMQERDFTGEVCLVTIKQRIGQSFFRNSVLSSYNGKCCISGVRDARFLVASHIVAWKDANMSAYFINSVIQSGSTVILTSLISTMAAYALARFDFKLNKVLVIVFMLGMMVPMHTILVPVSYIIGLFNLKNNIFALVLVYVAFNLPFSIMVMITFMKGVNRSLEEAAIIDGASYFQIYSKIMIPLTLPAISTISIFNFMGAWNNILFPLLFINDKRLRPISLGLLNFSGERGSEYGLMMAGIVITVAVPLAIYLLFQEKVESGLAAGAVKE